MIGRSKIQKDVEDILIWSQDYPFTLNAHNLIQQWFEAKRRIITMFGGQTIIRSEKPIHIELSEEQKDKEISKFLDELCIEGVLTDELDDFISSNKEGFFENRVVEDFRSLNIRKGAKLSKSFKRFNDDIDKVRRMQDAMSRYIQKDRIDGYLYLSVDPIDFLTLSENNENWSSCHSLDGEYRGGNLSYMVDNTTIIAYIADDKQEHLQSIPKNMKWNSKKWRMLLHTNFTSCVYYSRQYPFSSWALLDEVKSMLEKYFSKKLGEPFGYGFNVIKGHSVDERVMSENYIKVGNRMYLVDDIIDVSDYNGYCDLSRSPVYAPILSLTCLRELRLTCPKEEEDKKTLDLIGLKIGKKAICPCCGEERSHTYNSFLCDTCIAVNDADEDFYVKCVDCGRRIYDLDEATSTEYGIFCKKCYRP